MIIGSEISISRTAALHKGFALHTHPSSVLEYTSTKYYWCSSSRREFPKHFTESSSLLFTMPSKYSIIQDRHD
jgi:hypothetical protein